MPAITLAEAQSSFLPDIITSPALSLGRARLLPATTKATSFWKVQLRTNNNGVGVYAHTAGVYVFGGAASANQTDFRFENGGTNTIHGFRSETAGKFIDDSGPRSLSVLDCIAQALKGPTAITLGGNHISIRDSDIGGDIKVGDHASGAAIDISNTAVQSKSIITIGKAVTNGTY